MTAAEDDVAIAVFRHLLSCGKTLAVAESCTGGLIGQRITGIGGSSRVFVGGVIAYANHVKTDLLGVSAGVLETVGAVSPETAEAMALGARDALSADLAVSVTGIAGPEGGSADRPVGLVYIGLADGTRCIVERFVFEGDRGQIRWAASTAALEMILAHVPETA